LLKPSTCLKFIKYQLISHRIMVLNKVRQLSMISPR